MFVASYLGIVWKHCREDVLLRVLGRHMRRAGAETTLAVQQQASAVSQVGELRNADVHTWAISGFQFCQCAQPNNRDIHTVNANGNPGLTTSPH